MSFRPFAALLLAALALPAAAHTPYPTQASFSVRANSVATLDASVAETFFVPEVVFDNSDAMVTGPDGRQHAPDTVLPLQTRTVIEQTLPGQQGTCRFSTGNRLGAVFGSWEVDGNACSSRDPAIPLPSGATLTRHYQRLSRSEVHRTAGAPTAAAAPMYGNNTR